MIVEESLVDKREKELLSTIPDPKRVSYCS